MFSILTRQARSKLLHGLSLVPLYQCLGLLCQTYPGDRHLELNPFMPCLSLKKTSHSDRNFQFKQILFRQHGCPLGTELPVPQAVTRIPQECPDVGL